jgi:hypothetical protein
MFFTEKPSADIYAGQIAGFSSIFLWNSPERKLTGGLFVL